MVGDLLVPGTPEDVRRMQDRYGRDTLIAWLSRRRTGIGRRRRDMVRTADHL